MPLANRQDIVRWRLQNQRLIGSQFSRPEAAVAAHLAVQSQDYGGAKWGLGQRVAKATDESVERAFQRGSLLRTHVLRPTWHFVVPADARWLLELSAPRIRAFAAPYFRKHGLDAAALKKSRRVLERALSGGEGFTREELGVVLSEAGLPTRGEALSYQLIAAELDAVLISGPRRGKQHTYLAFEKRVPEAARFNRDEALAELAQRYLVAHGPALAQDLAWWAGLTLGDAKRGIVAASGLESAEVEGKTYWFLPIGRAAKFPSPLVHLLPNYDEQLIAYKYRENVVDARVAGKLGIGSGVFDGHLLLIDGLLAGGWRRELFERHVDITVTCVRAISASEKKAVGGAAERYAEYLQLEPRLKIEKR